MPPTNDVDDLLLDDAFDGPRDEDNEEEDDAGDVGSMDEAVKALNAEGRDIRNFEALPAREYVVHAVREEALKQQTGHKRINLYPLIDWAAVDEIDMSNFEGAMRQITEIVRAAIRHHAMATR